MKRKFLNFIQQARVLRVIKCIIEFLIGREAHKQKKSSVHDLVNDKIIFVTAALKIRFFY